MDRNTTIGGIVSRKTLALAAAAFALVASLALSSVAAASTGDRNRDRIPDRWEKRHHLSLKVNQAKRDQDKDGLNNAGEFRAGLNPRDDDSDDDGIEDGNENAGTIASFTGGVLVVKLAGGGTLTATVTPDTEIECDGTATASSGGDDGPDDQGGGNDDGDDDHGHNSGPGGAPGDDNGDDHGDDHDNCAADALTVNRQVKEAELKTSNGTAIWEKVELGA
jgi:hypothetical protein